MSNGKSQRSSIFGGLLLILIGVLLLVALMRPDVQVWRMIAQYWPAVLILWGIAKLVDYFAARSAGEPPRRTFTGGDIFLLIVVLVFGGAITSWFRVIDRYPPGSIEIGPWSELGGQEHTFTAPEIVQVAKPDQQVGIDTDWGNISVLPDDTPQIRVVAKKTVRSWEEKDAEERADRVKVAIQEVPGGYEIAAQESGAHRAGVRVDLEVHVPKQSQLKLRASRGNVQVEGTQGSVGINARRGDVEIRNVAGEVAVEMQRGDIRIANLRGKLRVTGRGSEVDVADVTEEASVQGEFYGPIRFKNVAKEVHYLSQRTDLTVSQLPGRLELGSGAAEVYDTPGNFSITSRDRDVTIENVGGRIRVENKRGNVQIRLREAPKQEIEISNDSGNVELVMPKNAAFDLTASSRQGEVESDFQAPTLKSRQDENSSLLEGTVGTRGPKIQLRTSYGPVRLRRID